MQVGSARLLVGCSGWSYDDWAGRFYPEGLAPADRLSWYATWFDAVEVNATHYRTPTESAVCGWRDSVGPDFHFAIKLHRFGTHRKKLADSDGWVPRSLDPIAPLGPRAGTVLLQLPPRWKPRLDRLDETLTRIGRRHHVAVEVRDERWLGDDLDRLLSSHGAVRVRHDLLTVDPPTPDDAPFEYYRFHGPDREHPYHGSYDDQHLVAVARRAAGALTRGVDIEAYFNNDWDAAAPYDATRFRALVIEALGLTATTTQRSDTP